MTYTQAAIDTQRRATGQSLIAISKVLDKAAKDLAQITDHRAPFLDDKEAAGITKVASHLDACETALGKMSVRLGVK